MFSFKFILNFYFLIFFFPNRKRKSHPLSNEIFSSSTCARVQPYKVHVAEKRRANDSTNTARSSVKSVTSSLLTSAAQVIDRNSAVDVIGSDGQNEKSKTTIKISNGTVVSSMMTPSVAAGRPINVSAPRPQRNSHGWHTSMVCLKARAPPKSLLSGEDDVQEEDEVKLLEFAANCNWEGAKKEILHKIAPCLSRGKYPEPRTMNVCEFVVEILPKAHQPSIIPAELRAKLPGQMYSIRVRITRRDSHIKQMDSNVIPVIDLSDSSPKKKSPSIHNVTTISSASTNGSSVMNSTVGISGLNHLLVKDNPAPLGLATESLLFPTNISRRLSSDSKPVDLTVKKSKEESKGSDTKALTSDVNVGKVSLIPSTSVTTHPKISSSSDIQIKTVPSNATGLPLPSTGKSLLKTSTSAVIKYMKMPGNNKVMKVLEVGQGKNKQQLVAVPMALPPKQTDLKNMPPVVAVSVSGASQPQMVPLLPSNTFVSPWSPKVSLSSSKGPPPPMFVRVPAPQSGQTHITVHHKPVMPGVKTVTDTSGNKVQLVPMKSLIPTSLPMKVTSNSKVKKSDDALRISDSSKIKTDKDVVLKASNESCLNQEKSSSVGVSYSLPTSQSGCIPTVLTSSVNMPIMSANISPNSNKVKSEDSQNSFKSVVSKDLVNNGVEDLSMNKNSGSSSESDKISDKIRTGMKRSASVSLLDINSGTTTKKANFSENSLIGLDEDSNMSASSLPGASLSSSPSPLSATDRPISVQSSVLSTGSSDGLLTSAVNSEVISLQILLHKLNIYLIIEYFLYKLGKKLI